VDAEPTLDLELAARADGAHWVAGVDEVGRGALGGPVYAAAVVLPLDEPDLAARLQGVRDSKVLPPAVRLALLPRIRSVAVGVAVGRAAPLAVDALGIVGATQMAMLAAVASLPVRPDLLIVDGRPMPALRLPQQGVLHGDRRVLSIAAASVVAKVHRDADVIAMAWRQPHHGWDDHKGYGAPAHLRALVVHGPTLQHRLTWAPVAPRLAWPARPSIDGWLLRDPSGPATVGRP
jgi:ribonuclease HII